MSGACGLGSLACILTKYAEYTGKSSVVQFWAFLVQNVLQIIISMQTGKHIQIWKFSKVNSDPSPFSFSYPLYLISSQSIECFRSKS